MASQLDRIEQMLRETRDWVNTLMKEREQTRADHALPPSTGPGSDQPSDPRTPSTGLPFGLSAADLVFMRHAQENAVHRWSAVAQGRGLPDIYEALLGGTELERADARRIEDIRTAQETLADWRRQHSDEAKTAWIAKNVDPDLVDRYNRWISGLEEAAKER
jgi:hypothetical protein